MSCNASTYIKIYPLQSLFVTPGSDMIRIFVVTHNAIVRTDKQPRALISDNDTFHTVTRKSTIIFRITVIVVLLLIIDQQPVVVSTYIHRPIRILMYGIHPKAFKRQFHTAFLMRYLIKDIKPILGTYPKVITILASDEVDSTKHLCIVDLQRTIADKEEIIKARNARIVELEHKLAVAATSDLSHYPYTIGAAEDIKTQQL
jgi:hypothetical protein